MHTLLEALQRLPKGLYTLVVGNLPIDSNYVGFLRQKISKEGLSDSVEICGSLAEYEIAHQLESSHLLVVPSSYEGFGIVYLEGMGFVLPAIGITDGAAGEIITHGQDGYLIPFGDATVLSKHLLELENDRERLLAISLLTWIMRELESWLRAHRTGWYFQAHVHTMKIRLISYTLSSTRLARLLPVTLILMRTVSHIGSQCATLRLNEMSWFI